MGANTAVISAADAARTRLRQRREAAAQANGNPNSNATHTPTPQQVLGVPTGAPNVRRGEDAFTSRGFSYARMAGLAMGYLRPEECQAEVQAHGLIQKAYDGGRCPGFHRSNGRNGCSVWMAPLDPAFYGGDGPAEVLDRQDRYTLRSMLWAGGEGGGDPEQAQWLANRHGSFNSGGFSQKSFADSLNVTQKAVINQGWVAQAEGGALIPFPEFGPLIPLLRNKNSIMSAGCQVFPLPPSGQIAFPRQATPTSYYWVGQGVKITQSNVTTDQVTFRAKKIGVFLITNNELIRFGGPIVEQMFRNDMTITLGLGLDYTLLQAEGSDNVPAGLIGYPGVQSFNATGSGSTTNGYTLAPQDLYTMIGKILAANGEFEGWIIRPELLYALVGHRSSVLASGDNLGLFLYDILRGFNKRTGGDSYFMGGHEVTASANVPINRVKGGASNLTTLYGGMWSNYRIGMYGTIEFAQAVQGDNVFPQDQTLVRALCHCDGAPLNPGVFIYSDALLSATISP
jgi:HK97 family phage major capsid protein